MVLAVEAGQSEIELDVEKWMLTILGGFTLLGSQAWEWSHLYTYQNWF
jgi:cytochrome c oxidase subunit 3